MDNVEHLLEDITLVSDILSAVPGVRILTTSRERLNLREEWVLEVSGLRYPASETETEFEGYSAVELFVQQARRVSVGFTLQDVHKPAVIRICHLVSGMPLGIELAAAWVRALTCEQIADEIERSLDVLETPARNVEPRHRNMRAALDQSWHLLTDKEREVLRKLSVFRGGFTREAGEQVAGATLWVLTALVDKSTLRVDVNGRYDLQELVRQYADEKLREMPAEEQHVQERHCTYYYDFLGQWRRDGEDIGPREAWAAIREELENVRVAFQRAVEDRAWNLLTTFLQVLGPFYEVSSRHREGAEVYHLAVECLRDVFTPGSEGQARLLGLALSWRAWFLLHLVRDNEARQLAQESLSLVLPLGNTFEAYNAYKVLSFATPDHVRARAFAQDAMKHAHESDYYLGVITMYHQLSHLSFLQGEYEETERLAQEGLALCRKHKWLYGEIWLCQRLSNAAEAQNNYVEARRMAQAALSAAQTVGSRHAISMQHLTLGNIAYAEGNYSDAVQHCDTSLQLAREVHNLQHIVWTISSLGCAVGRLGDVDLAWDYFREALNIAHSTQDTNLQQSAIKGIAELMMIQGHAERALELFVMLLHQSNNTGLYRQKDERLYHELELSLSPEILAARAIASK